MRRICLDIKTLNLKQQNIFVYFLILDVCSIALNRCLRRDEKYPPDDPNYQITLEYEFLDDAYNDWTLDAVRFDSAEGRGRGDLLTRKEVAEQLKKKNNHTLSVMVCLFKILSVHIFLKIF